MLKIPYPPQESRIFGTMRRPLITMKIFSETKVLIADTDDARPIFGRFNSLDLFEANFSKGTELIIN